MATPSCDNSNVVFIDTNLDTHLALLVSDLETVSDLKKRFLSEHPSCFPKIGQIQIHGIKVKRKGYFYHLSDSMFVRSAFHGFNKSWFLSVDVSALGECGQNEQLFSPASPNHVASLGIANNALVGPGDNAISFPSKRDNFQLQLLENKRDESEEIPVVSPCVSEHTGKEAVKKLEDGVKSSGNNDTGIPLHGSIHEIEDHCRVNHEVPSLHIKCDVDGSGKGTKDDCNVCEEDPSISVPSAKRKQKSKRKKEDTVRGDSSKDNTASIDNPLSCLSERASGLNNFQVPQSENKQDEREEIPFDGSCVSEHTEREAVKNLEMDVKSSGNDDHGIPNSHIECEVDESNKGIKDDCIVCEEGSSKPAPSAKKKHKSKRRKEDTVRDDTAKEKDVSVVVPDDYTVQQDFFVLANSSEKADKEVIKETEVLKEHQHTECNNNSANNDSDAVSMKEASEPRPAGNQKHKKRKRSLTHDSKEMLKVGTAYQKDEAQMSIEAHEESKESKDQSELHNDKSRDDVEYKDNKVTEDILDTRTPVKKKKKGKEKNGEKSLPNKKLINDFNEDKESKDQSELHNDKSRDDVEYKDNKVTEDILDTRTPAKKKKKGKEKNGEKSLPNKKLINDFNEDNASHHLLEDQQNIKNSSADQSAENFNDTDQLRTSVLGRRKKGKINSSDLHETPAVTSREDQEANHSSIQREVVQEEVSEDRLLSKDIIMSKTTLDKMEIGTDACKESIQPTVERTGDYKNHSDIEMKVQPSDVNEPRDLIEDNENVVLGYCHASEAGQTLEAEEGREVSPQNDPKLMLLERGTRSNQDNTNTNIRELNVTSNVVDVNGMKEPVKSEKKKRLTKKAKNSGGQALREGIGLVDASESETVIVKSLKATIPDPMSGNTETEENPLNQTEGKKIQQEEMQGTVLSVTEKEDDLSADNTGSLEQIKIFNAGNMNEHVDNRQRKKLNSKQTSTSKSTSDMLTKNQVLDSKKERGVQRIHPDKKVPSVHKTGQEAKLSSRSDSAMSSIGENRKSHNSVSGKSMDLEKRRERITISNSKLEVSNKMAQNKAGKASRNNVGGAVSNTQKKSLLEGAIFKDDSSSTSQDEEEVDNSDASTRTPSDNSLLSDFSDGDINSGLDSQGNGSYDRKRRENGERSSLKASLSGTKGMPIDRVLRSSSRYKKAKITASQLDESESQPEFVPDSLADM